LNPIALWRMTKNVICCGSLSRSAVKSTGTGGLVVRCPNGCSPGSCYGFIVDGDPHYAEVGIIGVCGVNSSD